jgi:hypothetical protein
VVTGGQNEAPGGLPNVLHDQGTPNTLGGLRRSPPPEARLPWRGLTIAATLATLAVLLTLLVAQPT